MNILFLKCKKTRIVKIRMIIGVLIGLVRNPIKVHDHAMQVVDVVNGFLQNPHFAYTFASLVFKWNGFS